MFEHKVDCYYELNDIEYTVPIMFTAWEEGGVYDALPEDCYPTDRELEWCVDTDNITPQNYTPEDREALLLLVEEDQKQVKIECWEEWNRLDQ